MAQIGLASLADLRRRRWIASVLAGISLAPSIDRGVFLLKREAGGEAPASQCARPGLRHGDLRPLAFILLVLAVLAPRAAATRWTGIATMFPCDGVGVRGERSE